VPGGDKDTRYTVRRLTLDKHREITKRHTKPGTYRRPEKQERRRDPGRPVRLRARPAGKACREAAQPVTASGKQAAARRLAPHRAARRGRLNEIAAAEDARERIVSQPCRRFAEFWHYEAVGATCCLIVDEETAEEDAEIFECETCPVASALEELDGENRAAWGCYSEGDYTAVVEICMPAAWCSTG
jgi:hypothetical protein